MWKPQFWELFSRWWKWQLEVNKGPRLYLGMLATWLYGYIFKWMLELKDIKSPMWAVSEETWFLKNFLVLKAGRPLPVLVMTDECLKGWMSVQGVHRVYSGTWGTGLSKSFGNRRFQQQVWNSLKGSFRFGTKSFCWKVLAFRLCNEGHDEAGLQGQGYRIFFDRCTSRSFK